jgi:hypothetical protein
LYWLGLFKEAKKLETPLLNYLLAETQELANMPGASVLTLKGKRF